MAALLKRMWVVMGTRLQPLVVVMAGLLALMPRLVEAQVPLAPAVRTLAALGNSELRDNVAAAREKAIADALVTALAKVAADMMQPAGVVDHFARLNEDVFNRPNDFVQNYRVLTEHKTQGHYRVLVEVTVALERLGDTIGASTAAPVAAPPQRFVLLVAEQPAPGAAFQGWWMGPAEGPAAAALAQALTQKGLEVITPSGGPLEPAFHRPDLSDAEAIAIGRRLGAQAVVIGTATTAASANVMGVNIRSFQALIKARTLRVDPAGQIVAVSQSADASGEDAVQASYQALARAGQAAGQQIAEQIGGQGVVQAAVPTTVELIVSGTRSLADLVQFRRILAETPGVAAVKMVEMQPEQAILQADYKDRGAKLAEALLKRTHAAFAIRIAETKAQQLRIELVPVEPGAATSPKP